MIPATPEPKIPENGPEPEFQPEFFRNFEPSVQKPIGRVAKVRYSSVELYQFRLCQQQDTDRRLLLV